MNNPSQPEMQSSGTNPLKVALAIVFALAVPAMIFAMRGGVTVFGMGRGLVTWPGQVAQTATLGGWNLTILSRIGTGLQRADDITFFADGTHLAMTCPRYTKFTLWQTGPNQVPSLLKTVDLPGRPQRVVAHEKNIVIVQRPPGDDRHIKPGFFEVFDVFGARIAGPVEIGWDPDDLALINRDGRLYALALLSGNAEGEDNRPNPSVKIMELDKKSYTVISTTETEIPEAKNNNEDPLRILADIVSTGDGKTEYIAMITSGRNGAVRRLDWTSLTDLKWNAFWPATASEPLGASINQTTGKFLTADSKTGQIQLWPLAGNEITPAPVTTGLRWTALQALSGKALGYEVAAISESQSAFGLIGPAGPAICKLNGPYGFGSVRLMNIAVHQSGENEFRIAICDRTGGLHWVVLKK